MTAQSQTVSPPRQSCVYDSVTLPAAVRALDSDFMTFDVRFRAAMWSLRDTGTITLQALRHDAKQIQATAEALRNVFPVDTARDTLPFSTFERLRNQVADGNVTGSIHGTISGRQLQKVIVQRMIGHTPETSEHLVTFLRVFDRLQQTIDTAINNRDTSIGIRHNVLIDTLDRVYRASIHSAWHAVVQDDTALPRLVEFLDSLCMNMVPSPSDPPMIPRNPGHVSISAGNDRSKR